MGVYKLEKEVIELSSSKEWIIAKAEWIFESLYISEEPETCLCGKTNIINICVFRNTTNNKYIEIGNECAKKFLGFNDGDKLAQSVKKLKKDNLKSMNDITLMYLFNNEVINERDYKFYYENIKKRNLSSAQENYKKGINNKLLNYTSNETKILMQKLVRLLNSSPSNAFYMSLKGQLKKGKKLSEAQIQKIM